MNRYEKLMDRIAKGERILIDGATGTELERRGVAPLVAAWSGGGAATDPEVLRQIHEDYIASGANIIISNTFATLRTTLEDAGIGDQFEPLNRRSVEICCEARKAGGNADVIVAGGISHWSFTTDGHEPAAALGANAAQQAAIMADAGADLIMLEMMTDIGRMLTVLESAQKSSLPVWVGFTCHIDKTLTVPDAVILQDGERLTDAIEAIRDRNVPLVSIMHTEVEIIDACLDVLNTVWEGPVGVYAHSGFSADPHWIFDGVISPDDYADYAEGWMRKGVQIVGACCGTSPDHISRLAESVGPKSMAEKCL